MNDTRATQVDPVTVVGLGLLLLPLLTMWHEIGGHAATCVALGGRVTTLGAFYVECDGLATIGNRVVACAGVAVDTVLSLVAWTLWRRARSDLVRLVLYYVMIGKGFVAADISCSRASAGSAIWGRGRAGGCTASPNRSSGGWRASRSARRSISGWSGSG